MVSTPGRQVLILGVGNPLMGDDGAGIRAVELLEQYHLPEHFKVQEIGTPGWGLGAWFEGQASVVLIDAVQMGIEPGGWKKIDLLGSRLFNARVRVFAPSSRPGWRFIISPRVGSAAAKPDTLWH